MITTSPVELEGSLERDSLLGSGRFGVGTFSSVQGIDVCLMVLSVVESHDLLGDVRLESIIGVGKRGERVGHFGGLLRRLWVAGDRGASRRLSSYR
jgi:hypothetical protein